MKIKKSFLAKKLIIFDMDGTLTPTKSPIHRDMVDLLAKLLAVKKVAVIGGGKYALFREQFLDSFKKPKELLENLFIFPTTSTSFYRYKNGWKKVYAHELSFSEIKKIKKAFGKVFREVGYAHPKKVYGRIIEDRGTQVTFSALGQDVVAELGEKEGVRLKTKWKEENTPLKLKMAKLLRRKLPGLAVQAAGFTSIDVTGKGIDKAYGIRQIEKHLKVPRRDMLFVGDAIFPGGNDYAAVRTGVDYVQVSGPEEAKKLIKFLLKK